MKNTVYKDLKVSLFAIFLGFVLLTSLIGFGEFFYQDVRGEFFSFVHERFTADVLRRAENVDYSNVQIDQYANGNPRTADGHPSGHANTFWAGQLIKDLKLNELPVNRILGAK